MPHEPLSAAAVANEFLTLARKDGVKLTQMKLQKLVYYAHGWHLGLQGRPLIDEQVEAWPFGPVIPSLYSAFKSFGSKPISGFATELDEDGYEQTPRIEGRYDRDLVRRVWEEYGNFTAAQLSTLTHESGGPWSKAQQRNTFRLKTFAINNEEIEEYFAQAAKRNRGNVGS